MMDEPSKQLTQREQVTPKYRGIYDKALTGRSMKSAIHINCLLCVGCERKEIKNCKTVGCPFFLYRPYQTVAYRVRRRTTALISDHYVRGEKVPASKKSTRPIVRDVILKSPPSGRMRVKLIIEPEMAKDEQGGG